MRTLVITLCCLMIFFGGSSVFASSHEGLEKCEDLGELSILQKIFMGSTTFVQADAAEFCQSLRSLLSRLDTLEKKTNALEQKSIQLEKLVPSGSVIAIDSPNECPDGWDEFNDGAGKVIIGQGSGRIGRTDGSDILLSERAYREQGGAERVILLPDQMPTHSHDIINETHGTFSPLVVVNRGQDSSARNFSGDGKDTLFDSNHLRVGTAGANASHQNMPPFIALRHCLKE